MTVPDGFGLDQLNTASPGAAEEAFLACCSSPAWASAMVTGRPYADGAALLTAADRALERLDDAGLLEAMAGHPRIGERVTHAGGEWSRQEQSGMASADDRTTAELAEGNREYEARFGHVYLVSAAGRSGTELLDLLRGRLGNDPQTELGVARRELATINRNRLTRLLGPADRPDDSAVGA